MNPFALDQRRSTPSRLLGEPAPDSGQLLDLLRVASRVPDHGALAPWRFLTIRGDARAELGTALATRALALNPDIEAAALDKERKRFLQAPLVVAVIGCYIRTRFRWSNSSSPPAASASACCRPPRPPASAPSG
jgi:nitroreductase